MKAAQLKKLQKLVVQTSKALEKLAIFVMNMEAEEPKAKAVKVKKSKKKAKK